MDFLGLSGKTIVVMGVANRRSVAAAATAVLREAGARLVHLFKDEALLEMYAHKPSWRSLSSHFGRNINAIKLRLQHLGVDLGAEAGRARYLQRPGSRAAAAVEVERQVE